MFRHCLIFFLCLLCANSLHAKGVYQQPAEFVEQNFSQPAPAPQVIWLNDALKQQLEDILQHSYQGRRIRYWQAGQRSLWILEETGKKKPITVGIVIEHNRIQQIKVLVFRETRGWEVRHPFFTRQFNNAQLTDNNQLDQPVDGISGATLSVRALTKLARIALLLHKEISQ